MFCSCWANVEFAAELTKAADAVGSDESCCGVAVAAVSVAIVCNFLNKIISARNRANKKANSAEKLEKNEATMQAMEK